MALLACLCAVLLPRCGGTLEGHGGGPPERDAGSGQGGGPSDGGAILAADGASSPSEGGAVIDSASPADAAPLVSACESAAGSWTATLPPFGSTNYVVTFPVSEQVATQGGPVDVSWASPGIAGFTAAGSFLSSTCTLVVTYSSLCAASTAAGNGTECGDTDSVGDDVCPDGNAMTATFSTPALSWWDAHGCVGGMNCSTCIEHAALAVVKH